MEWLQDRLLRLAARYYCQDMDIDASKLQIEKWDAESCRVRATDLRLTNEHGALSAAECFLDVTGTSVAIEAQGTVTIAAPWKSIGAGHGRLWVPERGPRHGSKEGQAPPCTQLRGQNRSRRRRARIERNRAPIIAESCVPPPQFRSAPGSRLRVLKGLPHRSP